MHQSSIVLMVVHVLVTAVSVLVVGKVLPGITVTSYGSAIWFALVAGVLNALVWHFLPLAPIAHAFAWMTLGIGVFIINGIIFLVADKFSSGIQISGCFTAILASIGVSVMNWVFHLFIGGWAP